MSRSTQYIGLNAMAREYTDKLDSVFGPERNVTYGMFDEEILLGMWRHEDGSLYKEVVQDSPWSSGPMIFTCLLDEDGNYLFEWLQDPDLRGRNEVDYEHGRYYV